MNKDTELIADNISYALAIEKEKYIEIVNEIGHEFSKHTLDCEMIITRQIKMYEFIKNKYKEINEIFIASELVGRLNNDYALAGLFLLKYKLNPKQ